MAKPYTLEMEQLLGTFEWATKTDIAPLQQAVRTASLSSLLAIGSGGSLTAAYALSGLHQRATHRLAAIATPLEAVAEQLDNAVSAWLFSAGGGNVDILAAAKALISREYRQIAVLCGREDSPLAKLCKQHSFVDLLLYPMPTGKDGFLATNSLLGFSALLTRAYAAEFSNAIEWNHVVETIQSLLRDKSETVGTWKAMTDALWAHPTTLVLHGTTTRIGAIDLESKFTEAALGNIQLADYRNFAHGRHHWLAKRGDVSGVLAFISDHDRELAERTLALIPSGIPQARMEFSGSPAAVSLASLVAAFRVTGWAGSARGIDPGRPGVPEFGRKLYNLRLPRQPRRVVLPGGISEPDATAITRKTGLPLVHLASNGELEYWQRALKDFRNRLRGASFAGLALDYDGTLVDTRNRFDLMHEDMAAELVRILESGIHIAIATGRGVSVRRDLRKRLPKNLWPLVLIGYYNGAEVGGLEDDTAPDGTNMTCDALAPLATALRSQVELEKSAEQTDRLYQITLQAKRMIPENRLWDLTHQVILMKGTPDVIVTRSSHSVDILAPGVSKLNVLLALREKIGPSADILTIGDRGCWPGNDYELLREQFSLSVDETNVDPETCWNLAPSGQRGVGATLAYLQGLEVHDGILQFGQKAFR